MTTTLDTKYRDDLVLALRLRDVRGARIGEVVAEIESHVAETGEDPREAFGEPKAYAEQVATALDPSATGGWLRRAWSFLRPLGWRDGLIAILSYCAVVLITQGVWALGAARNGPFGLPATTSVLGGTLGSAVLGGVLWRRRGEADPVVDPRTGANMLRASRLARVVQVVGPLAVLAAMYLMGYAMRGA